MLSPNLQCYQFLGRNNSGAARGRQWRLASLMISTGLSLEVISFLDNATDIYDLAKHFQATQLMNWQ
jgi:hypothetical protein